MHGGSSMYHPLGRKRAAAVPSWWSVGGVPYLNTDDGSALPYIILGPFPDGSAFQWVTKPKVGLTPYVPTVMDLIQYADVIRAHIDRVGVSRTV